MTMMDVSGSFKPITAQSLSFGMPTPDFGGPVAEMMMPTATPGAAQVPLSQYLAGIGAPQQTKWGGRLQNIGTGIQALSGLASMYLGFKANKLAAEDLKFQKKAYYNNLEGTRTAWNDAVESRAYTRAAAYGDPSYAASYIDKNKLNVKGG
jgi:hypothetical protein